MEMEIISVHGHYVVIDENGNCVCSADTYKEAKEEIEKMYAIFWMENI